MTCLPPLPNRFAAMADKQDDMVIAPPKPSANPFAVGDTDSPSAVREVASRLTSLPQGLVDGGEIIILAVKPSMWRPVFDSVPWIMTLSFLALASMTWHLALPGLSVSTSAQVIFLLGMLRLGLAVIAWIPSWYVLTNRRLIVIRGVRTPNITSCSLLEVRNTYLNATTIEKTAHLGTITYVTTDEAKAPHYWRTITDPETVHAEIRRAIENVIDNHNAG